MRSYELVTIISPEMADDDVPQMTEKVSQLVINRGGTIDKVQRWGKRKLSYPIKRHLEGHYVLTQFTLDPNLASEVESELRVSEDILKYLIVRIDKPDIDSRKDISEPSMVSTQDEAEVKGAQTDGGPE